MFWRRLAPGAWIPTGPGVPPLLPWWMREAARCVLLCAHRDAATLAAAAAAPSSSSSSSSFSAARPERGAASASAGAGAGGGKERGEGGRLVGLGAIERDRMCVERVLDFLFWPEADKALWLPRPSAGAPRLNMFISIYGTLNHLV